MITLFMGMYSHYFLETHGTMNKSLIIEGVKKSQQSFERISRGEWLIKKKSKYFSLY